MSDLQDSGAPSRRPKLTGRKARNTFITKSGQTIKIHRNLTERIKSNRDAAARRKAARLVGLPKSPVKRLLFHLHPKRVIKYWFSREGFVMGLKLAGIGIIVTFIFIVGVFAYFRKDLPNLKDISGTNLGGSIRYYDRTGQTLLWEDSDGIKRVVVDDAGLSQNLKNATVAIEDKDFFKHGGFDLRGIIRAGINDALGRGATQGGSTITQQLVKLNSGQSQHSITRKIKELILSVEVERSYSKKEILAGYLNTAPYGNIQYGAETASQDYFQKSAKDLTVAEAAFLAGIPKSPSYYSPYGPLYKEDPTIAAADLVGRQHYILGLMHEQGMITKAQYDEAIKTDTLATIHTPKQRYDNIIAPWFVLTAKQELESRYGDATVKRGGWKVTTTVDLAVQKAAEEQVAKGLKQVQRQGGDEIGFAAEDVATGQMVALVGGVDFNDPNHGQYNYAHEKIPPGSSIKPYDYVSLLDNTTNFGAGSVLYDTKGVIPGYPCTTGVTRTGNCAIDYDLRYPGPLSLRYALGGSRNVPAMKAMLSQDSDPSASVNKTLATIKKLMQSPGSTAGEDRGTYACYQPGDETLTKTAQCGAAAAIGDGAYLKLDEHVHGYATLSRNGSNIPQTYILKIIDSADKVVDEWKPTAGVQAVRPDAAYIVDDMISDPNASYLATKPHRFNGWKFGFKTGTTNDSKDGLMMGMSTKYAAGVWVGYHDRTREMSGFMENMTQPILTGWMNEVHKNVTPVDRVRPSGVQTLPAFVVTTHVGVGSREPSPSTDLFPSWYKQPSKTTATKQTIDKVSNKLATDCTPSLARQDVTQSSANSFSGDKFVTGAATNGQQDDVHKCDDAKPTIQITGASTSTVTVVVNAGTHPMSSAQFPGTVNLSIDGQIVQSFSVSDAQVGSPMALNYTYSGSGDKTVTVQVIDSVLYDSSDTSGSLTFTAAGAISITAPGSTVNSNSTTAQWTGGTGPFTVTLNGSTVSGCGPSSCTLSTPGPVNKTYTLVVSDSTGTNAQQVFTRK